MDSIQGGGVTIRNGLLDGTTSQGCNSPVLYIKSNPRRTPLRRPKSDPQSNLRQELGRCQHPRLERRETWGTRPSNATSCLT
jgi:hypothetical protein